MTPNHSEAQSGSLAASIPGASGIVAALLAATCCILPLLLIFTGIAGAGIMMSMMQYEWLTLPLGTVGLVAAWASTFARGGAARRSHVASWAAARISSCSGWPRSSSARPCC